MAARRNGFDAHGDEAPIDPAAGRRALHAVTQRYETLVNLIEDCIFETDRHFRISRVSEHCLQHLGYYPVELIGCFLDDIIRPVMSRAMISPEQRRQPFRDILHTYVSREDTVGLVNVSAAPLYDPEDGSFLGMMGRLQEATDSPIVTQSLKKLMITLDDEFALIVISGPQGRVLYTNPRYREISGYSETEVRSISRTDLLFNEGTGDGTAVASAAALDRFGSWFEKTIYKTRSASLLPVLEVGFRIDLPLMEAALDLWLGFDDMAQRMINSVPTPDAGSRDDQIIAHATRLLNNVTLLATTFPGFPDPREGANADGARLVGSTTGPTMSSDLIASLPRRQREVLTLMMKGHSNKHIARHLGISEATVKSHVRAVCDRLGAENRTQAVVMASNMDGL